MDGRKKDRHPRASRRCPRRNVQTILRCPHLRRCHVHRCQRRPGSRPGADQLQPQHRPHSAARSLASRAWPSPKPRRPMPPIKRWAAKISFPTASTAATGSSTRTSPAKPVSTTPTSNSSGRRSPDVRPRSLRLARHDGPRSLSSSNTPPPLGNAPAHKLFERVKIAAKPGVTAARSFADYDLVIDDAKLPTGIKLHRKL